MRWGLGARGGLPLGLGKEVGIDVEVVASSWPGTTDGVVARFVVDCSPLGISSTSSNEILSDLVVPIGL
jgi:hypothetical protein